MRVYSLNCVTLAQRNFLPRRLHASPLRPERYRMWNNPLDKQDTLARFDRVCNLVEGFETPIGLELLATVHWVVCREDAVDIEETFRHFYDWGARKRRFSERQIRIAFETLRGNEWIARDCRS